MKDSIFCIPSNLMRAVAPMVTSATKDIYGDHSSTNADYMVVK